MRWWSELKYVVKKLNRRRAERELQEEIDAHLEMETQEKIADGLSREEARYAAKRAFGSVALATEDSRAWWGFGMLEELSQDLRYGARMLMKQKGVTLIAVLSLALGIGANTALFSVVDAMLLKLLPVKDPQRLVLFQAQWGKNFSYGSYFGSTREDPATGLTIGTSFPYQSYQRMREQLQKDSALSDLFAFGNVNFNILAEGQSELVSGQFVTGNYHRGLGVQPWLGRLLTDDDNKPAANPVAVLSYRYWQKRFGNDATVIGKQINLNNRAFIIIGVTPPGFEGAGQVGSTQDVMLPIAWEPQLTVDPKHSQLYGAGRAWLRVFGRLQPGATMQQAQAQLEAAFEQS